MDNCIVAYGPPPQTDIDPYEALRERMGQTPFFTPTPTEGTSVEIVLLQERDRFRDLVLRLVGCADRGYLLAELVDLVKDAKKAVSK